MGSTKRFISSLLTALLIMQLAFPVSAAMATEREGGILHQRLHRMSHQWLQRSLSLLRLHPLLQQPQQKTVLLLQQTNPS